MAKYSDWYEVELDGYLRGRIPDVQRFEALKEVSNHFAEHVDDLVEKGMDPIKAEVAAIQSFGSPRRAAMNLLANSQHSRVGGFLGGMGMATILVVIALLTFAIYGTSMHFQVRGMQYYVMVAFGIATFGSVLIILSSILTKRVDGKKFGTVWSIGIAVTALVCLVAGKPQYAGIPDREVPNIVQQWKAKNAIAFKLAEIDQKLKQKISLSHSTDDKDDMPGYLLAMKTEAPKLLKGKSIGIVDVVGQETDG